MKSYIAILCFIYVFHTASGQNARINAPAQFILNTDMVQIDCQPAGTLYNSISVISILKNGQPMVSVGKLNGVTSIAWSDSTVQSRATTNTPNLDAVSTAQLRMTIEATSTQCDDQAMYTCKVTGLDSTFNPVDNNEVSANVSVVASTTPAPGSGAQTGAGTANAGAIAGGVIGGLAFIILDVLIIYFVFVRKRNPSETYRTREEKDGKGNPNVGNEAPVYSVPGKHGGSNNGVPIRESNPENSQPPKVELHYADLDIASNPPQRPKMKKEQTEYSSVRFV
ncbi:hypothetical protein KUTeg_006148 [Tegillarca granosa]|uniref:Ig-like domain-containing protein n=1 Tax=Tegillarca granosa TaxID=220873 RepID=A0ABQ9FFP4_TEGGR|nr:hypothetical protein KUTeg_006148 [Tegillarca granosa]